MATTDHRRADRCGAVDKQGCAAEGSGLTFTSEKEVNSMKEETKKTTEEELTRRHFLKGGAGTTQCLGRGFLGGTVKIRALSR